MPIARAICIALAISPQLTFAAVGYGFDTNYITAKSTSTSSTGTTSSAKGSGYFFSPYARYTLPIGPLFKVGAGAYIGYGRVTPDSLLASQNYDVSTAFVYGADLFFRFEMLSAIKPFARIQFGRYSSENQSSFMTSPAATVLSYSLSGFDWAAIIGFALPMNDVLSLYFQAGFSASPKVGFNTDSITGNAAAVGIARATNYDLQSEGFRFGGGLSFDL